MPSHASILHEYLKRKSDFDFFFTIPQIQNDLLRCQTIEDVKVLISSVIANSSREIAAFVPANKKSTYVAGDDLKRNTKGNMVLQKQLLEYIDVTKISKYFDDELQSKMKQHLLHNYEEAMFLEQVLGKVDFFEMLHKENINLIKQLIKVAAQIRDSNCIVVFNEMFFGKAWNKDCKGASEAYSPLSQEQLTELFDLFYSLSRHKPQTIFYVNFLHNHTQQISGQEFITGFQSLATRWRDVFSHEIFEAVGVGDSRELLSRINPDVRYSTFANETFIYTRGQIIGKYRKMTYKDEADALLKANSLYLFGNSHEEELVPNSVQQWISTETCFDLKLGVRRRLNTYPDGGKLHIILSNTLPFSLADRDEGVEENFSHFPENIPFVLHVDPHQQELFLRIPPKKNFFLDKHRVEQTSRDIYQESHPSNLISHDPIMEVKFGIQGSVFTIKVFDMRAAVAKHNFYS